jgi:hypothetical protein
VRECHSPRACAWSFISSVSWLKKGNGGGIPLVIVGVGRTRSGNLSSLRGAGFPIGVLEPSADEEEG